MSASEEHGDPIAYMLLAEGTPVLSADGVRIGTVAHVLAAEAEDIFDGIVIGHLEHNVFDHGEHYRFVDAAEVASLHEHAVRLDLDAAGCRSLPAPSVNSGESTVAHSSELGGKLRRAWNALSGKH